ncbi:MAG: O-methyltransferase [Eubacteriales bacterium]|nr:O-methyltransferase [Eubacteriales bacterium]
MNEAERISEYLHSLEEDKDEFLSEIRTYAKEHDIPIIRRETESLLRTMLKLKMPSSILEIGAAIGYSSIVMAGASDADIITIENYEKRIPLAHENIKKAGLESRIGLREADAGEVLEELSAENKSFDFIFLDAAKGQYLIWLPLIKKLMHEGSVLIADNVLQDRTVAESRFTIARRDRTIHERMREFLYRIKHDPELESSVLNVGDGVSVSVKL